MDITTPIQPFSSTFESEIVRLADEVQYVSKNRDGLERLLNEPRLVPFDDGSDDFVDAVIKSSASLATNRWTYTCEPVEWDNTNKKWITLTSTTVEYTAYNKAEALNTASVALHGYDLSTDDYTLAVQKIPDDTPVRLRRVPGYDVYQFSEPNELVVTCTAPAADAMSIPTLYVPSNGSVTTTSGTYAAVTAWGDETLMDGQVFTWTKASGLAEAGTGSYRINYVADATTATNDSTLGIKAQYKIDAGSWTDVPATTQVVALSTLAANAQRITATGYVTAGVGEDLDVRLVVARTAGTGTPTIASGALFLEIVQVDL
jgi:hypothetical protein